MHSNRPHNTWIYVLKYIIDLLILSNCTIYILLMFIYLINKCSLSLIRNFYFLILFIKQLLRCLKIKFNINNNNYYTHFLIDTYVSYDCDVQRYIKSVIFINPITKSVFIITF